jgi:hypothetical protein
MHLIRAGQLYHRGGTLDFDPAALGRQYVERGIALQPDSRSAQVHRVMLQRMDSYQKLTDVMRRGSRPEDLVKNGTDEDRLYVLPTLIRSDIYRGRSVVAEGRARDYLALVEQHPNHPRYQRHSSRRTCM